jgi:hypothetical protein
VKRISILFIVSFLFILSCEDKVEKDTTPPELTISYPLSGSTVGEVVSIKVITIDNTGILKVDFYIDNTMMVSDTTSPYDYEWNTTTVSEGSHTIKVVSHDTKENFVESEFSVTVDNESKKPSKPTLNKISYNFENNVFKITWGQNTDDDFKSYTLYESESEDMSGKSEKFTTTNNSIISYDLSINIDLVRYYQLVVEDKWGLTNVSDVRKGSSWVVFSIMFGGDESDEGNSVQQTTDGGYIVLGTTRSYGNGESDILLVKIDNVGNEEWRKTFGGINKDIGNSVQQTTDGGYIISGTTFVNSSNPDLWLIKTDSNGEEEWNKTFGGNRGEYGGSVQQTSDGGYIFIGSFFTVGKNQDIWLIKTDSNGEEEWNKIFGQEGNFEMGYSVQETSDGGFILLGEDYDTKSMGYLIKTDSQGIEEWSNNKYDSVFGTYVQQTTDGGYIFTGFTTSGSYSYILLIKTDSNGNEEWNQTYGGGGGDGGNSVQQTTDGGYIITGWTGSFGKGSTDVWLIKTNSQGTEEWNKTLGGSSQDDGSSIQQTSDGGFVIIGKTESFGSGDYDIWLIKTDSQGNTVPESEWE